jgi:hypothetical protein
MALVVVSMLLSVLSTLLIGALIAPMVATQRARKQILDVEPSEFNVFFFMKITEYSKKEYLEAVNNLTEEQIIEQLASDAHNSSRLLTMRLERLKRAYLAFIISIVMFAILGVVSLLI